MINISKIGTIIGKLAGVSKSALKAENKLLKNELGLVREELATATTQLGKAKSVISEAEALKARTFASISTGKEQYSIFSNNIKKIAQGEAQVKSSLERVATNQAIPEDYQVINEYSKSLKSHYHKLSKNPQFFERADELLQTELKATDKDMFSPDFAECYIKKVKYNSDPYAISVDSKKYQSELETAKKSLRSVYNRQSISNEVTNFAYKHNSMYPNTYSLRNAVVSKNVKTYVPQQ